MPVEAVNEKKMVSFRISLSLETEFRLIVAKAGVKGENIFTAFVESLIEVDQGKGPDYRKETMTLIVERARKLREMRHYRGMYLLNKELTRLRFASSSVAQRLSKVEAGGEQVAQVNQEKESLNGRQEEVDHEDHRPQPDGTALRKPRLSRSRGLPAPRSKAARR